MQNLSQFGPVVHSGEGLGMKKGHSIFYYESTCTVIIVHDKNRLGGPESIQMSSFSQKKGH